MVSKKRTDIASPKVRPSRKNGITTAISEEPPRRNHNSGPFENAVGTRFAGYDVGPSDNQNIAEKFNLTLQGADEWMLDLMKKCKEMTVLCVLVKKGKLDVLRYNEEQDFGILYQVCKNPASRLMDIKSVLRADYLPLLTTHDIWGRFAAIVMDQLDNDLGRDWPLDWPCDVESKLNLDLKLKLRLVNVVSGYFYMKVAGSDGGEGAVETSEEIAGEYMRDMNWDAEITLNEHEHKLEDMPLDDEL